MAHDEFDRARPLCRLGQLVDEETIGLLALHRFCRDANDANDIILRRAQLDRRRARDDILRRFQAFPPRILNPAENPDLGRDRFGPVVAKGESRSRAGRHDLQKNGSDLQGRGRGAARGEPAGEQ